MLFTVSNSISIIILSYHVDTNIWVTTVQNWAFHTRTSHHSFDVVICYWNIIFILSLTKLHSFFLDSFSFQLCSTSKSMSTPSSSYFQVFQKLFFASLFSCHSSCVIVLSFSSLVNVLSFAVLWMLCECNLIKNPLIKTYILIFSYFFLFFSYFFLILFLMFHILYSSLSILQWVVNRRDWNILILMY